LGLPPLLCEPPAPPVDGLLEPEHPQNTGKAITQSHLQLMLYRMIIPLSLRPNGYAR
jgi:hypothetical protein